MPTIPGAPKVNPKRAAALLAGFDTGNSCEAEAMSKGLALRRMAAESKIRIVDLLEMPEVRRAVDEQMQPKRAQCQELQTALENGAALRQELTERTRDVRKLAGLLKRQETTIAALREELTEATRAASREPPRPLKPESNQRAAAASVSNTGSHSFGAQSWVFEFAAIVTALVLTVVAMFR